MMDLWGDPLKKVKYNRTVISQKIKGQSYGFISYLTALVILEIMAVNSAHVVIS